MGRHSTDFTGKVYAKFSPESAYKSVMMVLEGGIERCPDAQSWGSLF
jgi:hypothetical protein